MTRILLAASGIGLGHVARSRVVGAVLGEMGARVEYVAPPPTGALLEAYGVEPHPVSRMLESYSPVVEGRYEATGSGRISLSMQLEEARIARSNAEIIKENLDLDRYDAIVSDESWELMYLPPGPGSPPRVLVTDFIYYPYRYSILAGLAFNRFISRRIKWFNAVAFVGFPEKLGSARWPPVVGRRIVDMARRLEVVGPIPPVLPGEVLNRDEAARVLGEEDRGDKLVLASPGGTRAGSDIIRRAVLSLVAGGYRVYTTLQEPPAGALRVPEGLRLRLPTILKAFHAVVTMAGLSSIAGSAALGVPSLVVPLPGHFEQEENASIASRRYWWIRRLDPQDAHRAADALGLLGESRPEGDGSLFMAPYRLAKLIMGLAGDAVERDS